MCNPIDPAAAGRRKPVPLKAGRLEREIETMPSHRADLVNLAELGIETDKLPSCYRFGVGDGRHPCRELSRVRFSL